MAKESNDHWYRADGTACHWVPKADGKGTRPTTLRDARKLNLIPSVTTILKILHKQALVDWLVNQAVMAVLTAPRELGEDLDTFVDRVLNREQQQDQESQKARDLGTDIHAALEAALRGQPVDDERLRVYVDGPLAKLRELGKVLEVEKILVGDGFAGKTDVILESGGLHTLVDFKSAKKIPDKGSWPEHRLQLSAYASAYGKPNTATGNLYISTAEPGRWVYWDNGNWQTDFEDGFLPLVKHWQWANNYVPSRSDGSKPTDPAWIAGA